MTEISEKTLLNAHLGAGIFHLAQAAFGTYWLLGPQKDEGFWQLTNSLGITRNPGAPQRPLGDPWRLSLLVPAFSALSSVNHLYSYSRPKEYKQILTQKANPVRWLEYGFSAGLMLVVIAVLSGVDDIKPLLILIISNFALQMTGYNVERDIAAGNKGSANRQNIQGFILFMAMWAAILTGFITNVASDDAGDNSTFDERPGAEVYTIVFGLFILFIMFGVLSSLYSSSKIKSFKQVELGYIVLSFVAKTLLANLTLFGSVFSTDDSKVTVQI